MKEYLMDLVKQLETAVMRLKAAEYYLDAAKEMEKIDRSYQGTGMNQV